MTGLVTDRPDIAANDLVMAKTMSEVLNRHYPGHMWAVNVQGVQGIATIYNLALSGRWGFVLRLPDHYSASDFDRAIVNAGGELLERYRLARGKFSDSAHAGLKTDFAGNIEHE